MNSSLKRIACNDLAAFGPGASDTNLLFKKTYMKRVYLLVLLMSIAAALKAQVTYTWNTSSGAWTSPGNWTPLRNSPQPTDRLVFNGLASYQVTGVPSQTIGSLTISGGAQVSLQPINVNTLTIGNGTGIDLSIAVSSVLIIDGGTSLSISLVAGATATIPGVVLMSNGQHVLRAADAGAIHFTGSFNAGPGFTGNPFGATSTANSVIFESGSSFIQEAGSNPFALPAPASVVVFESGSMCEIKGNVGVSFDGRTYANLDIDGAAANISGTGSTGFTVDTLRVHQGSLALNMTGPIHIRGYLYVELFTSLSFTGTGTIHFDGSTPQYIYNDGTLTFGDGEDITMNNITGLTIQSPVSFGGVVNFASGNINTSSIGMLTLRSTASVTGASAASFVNGPLIRETAGTVAFNFPVGKTGSYRSVEIIPAAAAVSSYTAEYFNVAYSDLTICNARLDAIANNEYWDISKNNGADAAVRLNYAATSTWSTATAPDATKAIVVAHYNGTCWGDEAGTFVLGSSGPAAITSRDLSTFSPFTFGYGPLNVLPVHFTSVRAIQQSNGIRVEWSNLTETDILDYSVERSSDGNHFTTVHTENARSNNGSRADYSFLDVSMFSSVAYYRIKARSSSENKYSLIVKVNTKAVYTFISVYPNPVINNQFSFQATALPKGVFTIRVLNTNGQQVHRQLLRHNGGSVSETIQLPEPVTKGRYVLMMDGNNLKLSGSFIVL
jgi:hypothetical protein